MHFVPSELRRSSGGVPGDLLVAGGAGHLGGIGPGQRRARRRRAAGRIGPSAKRLIFA